jgi:type VI secretion system protein ImpG
MNDDLLPYYNSELAYLRDAGAEFAAKYPRVAGRLQLEADRCEDPHVERLLEGFAFLAARLRLKIDDEYPEVADALLGMLYPHYQRPLPSMSIVQFRVARGQDAPTAGFRIEPGARLVSPPVGGTPCRFRTVYPVTLWPIEVAEARLEAGRLSVAGAPPGTVALLHLVLRSNSGAPLSDLAPARLRFYLDGEGPVTSTLYELLLNDTRSVVARWRGPEGATETITLMEPALEPVGFGRDEGMIPYPARSFPGYRLLQEYFALPEKFLFVDLVGLDRLAGRGLGDEVELLVFLDRAPGGDLAVGPENFRLGCTPIVNLFPHVAEPIALTHRQPEYRVVPDVHRPLANEVYSIDEVFGVGSYLRETVRYEPFYSLRHAADGGKPRAYWYATRRPSQRQGDGGTEVDLAFVDPGFNPRLPAAETITVRATCTNRDLPALLPFGGDGGDFELEAQAPVGRVRCLRKPTRTLRPALGRGAQWRLISHLALNHLSLVDSEHGLEALREILRIYDFADGAVSRQQIAGITRVASRRVAGRAARTIGDAATLGMEVTLEFDEAHFVGSGAFLLASVLERFLGLYVSINSFCRLVATTKRPEGILKRWPPRAGERTLL